MESEGNHSKIINSAMPRPEIEAITNYAERNRRPAQEGRKCVDGRYDKDQAAGMIARAGGDFGYVMALAEANVGLTPDECFDKVYAIVTKRGPFYMHTDTHADPENPDDNVEHLSLIGCGHIGNAAVADYSELYGLDPQVVEHLVGHARTRQAAGDAIEIVNLAGDHQERDVLIVRGMDETINAHDEQEMHFIYDQDRDEAFMKDLVEQLQADGVPITYEAFKAASDRQLGATLQLLAPGKAIYEVDFRQEKPTVSFVKTIEAPHA